MAFYLADQLALNLLTVLMIGLQNIENKQSLDVIYIDFAKAFDSVVHRKLIVKLMSYGISGCLLSWLEHFLTDRFQYVCIDGFYSSTLK